MNDSARADVAIENDEGFSTGLAEQVVRTALRFDADVRLRRAEGRGVRARNFHDVLSLVTEPLTEVTVIARGPDACAVVHALKVLFLSAGEVAAQELVAAAGIESLGGRAMALVA